MTITEDNDPNDLIGRPSGYTDAAVVYDSEAECTELGVDCGATIEIWPSEAFARGGVRKCVHFVTYQSPTS